MRRAGVAEFFGQVAATLEFLQFEPRPFLAQGETVVVLGYEHSRMKSTDRTFKQEWVHVYTLRDGKIATCRIFEDTAACVAALDGG
jgi:ketosteroid isomerase-like protein